jgi:hypothetical protein
LFVLVFGLAMMAFGYSDLSVCLSSPNGALGGGNCWDPFNEPDFAFHNFAESVIAFYVGAIITTSGAVMLVGPNLARLLGRSPGPE